MRKTTSPNHELTQRSLTPSESTSNNVLEHTFGDGEFSGKNLLGGGITESGISLNTESIFNIREDEMSKVGRGGDKKTPSLDVK